MKTFLLLAIFVCWSTNVVAQERGAINGRVVSESGRPLVNIYIRLNSSSGGISRSTMTDTEGRFQFNGLADRTYSVSLAPAQGYLLKPAPVEDRGRQYRPGDNLTFTMVKGGVITGRVTDPEGNPVISIPISLFLVFDRDGKKQNTLANTSGMQRSTDDRGVYRIYGVQPGTYIVAANPNSTGGMSQFSPYIGQTATYHPSATRDTAIEIKIDYGTEANGVDIRFRAETGRVISGKIIGGGLAINNAVSVSLSNATSDTQISNDLARPTEGQHVFSLAGIADGEYILSATFFKSDTEEVFNASPRRITVKGTDITGQTLSLIPMATVTGNVVLEKSPIVCPAKLSSGLRDVSLTARRAEKTGDLFVTLSRFAIRGVAANEKGEFKLTNLTPGQHRLTASPRNENWFVKSIHVTPAGLGKSSIVADLVRSGILLKPGELLPGVTVTLAEGAASINGKLAPTHEGDKLPELARVYLVPAEPTAADNLLRYFVLPTLSAKFSFSGIAPGKYWLLAKPIAQTETTFSPPAFWDAADRAKLRKEAEAAKNEIELKACQGVKDFVLRF